jgi:hypothetical protein
MLGVGIALVAGGCSTDRELTEPEPVPVTEELIVAAVLTADDLPDSFATVDGPGTPINAEAVPEHDCDDGLTKLEPKEQASTDFTSGDVRLTSTVAWFPGQGAAVDQVMRDLAANCAQVVIADQGLAIRAAGLDFGVLTDNTLAVRIEVEPSAGAITERDLILLREGDLVHLIRLTGPRPSDKAVLDQAVRAAMGPLGLLHDDTT